MNNNISLLVQWINDPNSVNQEQLEVNDIEATELAKPKEALVIASEAARFALSSIQYADAFNGEHVSARQTRDVTIDLVDKYFELTGEDRE